MIASLHAELSPADLLLNVNSSSPERPTGPGNFCSELLLVLVTGNTIYMVGHRIASQMVAQDARNKTQSFRQVRALGGGNTLHPVCGCIIPVLRCTLGLLEAYGVLCYGLRC